MCRLSVAVCNSKRIWNDGKCRGGCREDLVDKIVCDKGLCWNPFDCSCECDISCGIGEYLDYKTCLCKKTLVDKLVEECTSVIDENKVYNETLSTFSSNEYASCTVYVVLFAVFLATSIITDGVFVYFHWYLRRNDELDRKKEK